MQLAQAAASQSIAYGFSDGPEIANQDAYGPGPNCWFLGLTIQGTQGNGYGYCPSNHSGRLSYARIGVPWDSVFSSSTNGTQAPSCVWGTGTGLQTAEQAIANAKADGLTPMVVLTWQDPHNPQPPSDNGYYCGLEGLMVWMSGTNYTAWNGTSYNLHVSDWELFNEPDGFGDVFNNDPGNKFGHMSGQGPYAAGDLYVDALYSRANAGGADLSDNLAVGAFSTQALSTYASCCYFLPRYLLEVAGWSQQYNTYPAAITAHPYDDITTAGADGYEEIANLLSYLNQTSGLTGRPIWLTETAAWLDSVESSPGNHWGINADGNPCVQYNAAQTFLNIAGYSSEISRIYWHEFQIPLNSAQTSWDSGLFAPASPWGSGGARADYFPLANLASGSCSLFNPTDASDTADATN